MNKERGRDMEHKVARICKSFPWERYNINKYSYPGHIHKARRDFKELMMDKRRFHFVVEIRDARLQHLDHPDLHFSRKHIVKVILFTKIDLLSSVEQQKLFMSYKNSFFLSTVNPKLGISLKNLTNYFIENCSSTHENQSVHVVGYPNTGKSTLINSLRSYTIGKSGLKTGNIAGITRHIQKVRFLDNPKIELVDFPGVLVPPSQISFEDALKLSILGSCKFDTIDPFLEAHYLIYFLKEHDPEALNNLKIGHLNDFEEIMDILQAIGKNFNIIKKKQEIDLDKTANFVLQRYKDGKLTSIPFT